MMHPAAFRCAVLIASAALQAAPAAAQNWPARPVRVVVPYAPGGGADIVARMLAQKLSEQTGGTFVIDNRPGAGGIVGAEAVARAPADGYTLLSASTEFGTNPAVQPKLPYDPFRDFTHLSQLGLVQFLLVSHPAVPVKNVRELIVLAKKRPGQLTYGSTTFGGGPHLAGELLQSMTGIRWVHVPFKGAGPASIALMGGEIDFMFAATGGLVGHVRTGKVRAIAVTGPRRFAELPDTPTVAESGAPGYNATGWYGLYAPAGLPAELARRLNAEAGRAFGDAEVKARLAQNGTEALTNTPEEFTAFLRGEIAKWTRVIKEANIRAE
jgi:tripartite-type tricarboxylate transporter receptor subunit TctC